MIKVFLVDDEIATRESLRNFLSCRQHDYILVGEAPDGEIALPMIQDSCPDILITDIRMPFMDGLELSKKIKSLMPWLKVIILSGYDDFAYAQQAIALGVQEYLLKPITGDELLNSLNRISQSLVEEKREKENIASIRHRLIHGNRFLMDKLMDSLLNNSAEAVNTNKLNEQIRMFGVDLMANCYIVVDISFHLPSGDLMPGRAVLFQLAESSGGSIQMCSSSKGMKALVMGDNENDADDRSYAFANSALHELNEINARNILITLGEPVPGPADISRSMKSARHLRHVFLRQAEQKFPAIVGIHDISAPSIPLESLDLSPLYERLQYISLEDLSAVFDAYVATLDLTEIHATVTLNYLQMETLITALKLVRDVGGDPSQALSIKQYETGFQSDDIQTVFASSLSLLREALIYRSKHFLGHGNSAIIKARSYLAQHYANPNLMLKDVAKVVAMSNSRFSTVFAQETGYTFTEYLMALRMSKAKELLKVTAMRSSDICFSVGYNDPHYFSYLFKKNEGMTPSEYRKQSGARAKAAAEKGDAS